ncbi:DUF6880 family protein [Methylotuvimicrobium sp. KM2]|uniref:DUF6880 family protein n=1 Tax=Methylotuvimicrobium sp. KM2 TaxID=3133976 RepID=UPI003100FD5C
MNEENTLRTRLNELPQEVLADFICSLYGEDERLDRRIERLLISEDSNALTRSLRQQISTLKHQKNFVDYYEAESLADEIQELLAEIEHHIMPSAPEQAFKLLDALLATSVNSLERSDDSNGAIGGVYQDACILWLQAARLSPAPPEGWQDRVKNLVNENDYGIYDVLLPNAHQLLPEEELRHLALFYETGVRNALNQNPNGTGYFSELANLQGIAEALKDPALYERSMLLVSPEPNSLQIGNLARFYLRCEDYQGALKWLTEPWPATGWQNNNAERLSLLAECYRALDLPHQQKEALKARLDISPTFENLQALLPLAEKDEAEDLRQRTIEQAMLKSSVSAKLELLFQLGEFDRSRQVLFAESGELAKCHYLTLTHLLGLVPAGAVLIRIILQRCLLDDILNRGKSQAYHYAADYLKELRKLDQQKPEYGPMINHTVYEQQLRAQHGRKRSFWPLVDTK